MTVRRASSIISKKGFPVALKRIRWNSPLVRTQESRSGRRPPARPLQHSFCVLHALPEKIGFLRRNSCHGRPNSQLLNADSYLDEVLHADLPAAYDVDEGFGDSRSIRLLHEGAAVTPLLYGDQPRMFQDAEALTDGRSSRVEHLGKISFRRELFPPALSFFVYMRSRIWSAISSKALFPERGFTKRLFLTTVEKPSLANSFRSTVCYLNGDDSNPPSVLS